MAEKTVAFVCQHGAFRSRMAAAFFNADPPPGWRAVSLGLTPQSEVSTRLLPLLEGTGAEEDADLDPPRGLDAVPADVTVAIDVPLGRAERWTTSGDDEAVRDQIRAQVQRLSEQLSHP